jgi:hypothetical protein
VTAPGVECDAIARREVLDRVGREDHGRPDVDQAAEHTKEFGSGRRIEP